MNDKEYYKFQLAFRGKLVENSVDAYDVANTILATSQVLHELSVIRYGEIIKEKLQININAFKQGSLLTDFIILAKDLGETSAPLFPLVGEIYSVGSSILKGYKAVVEIRKILKGKKPRSIVPVGDTNLEITGYDNTKIVINYNDFRAVQSKTISRNLAKIAQPLTKDSTLLDQIAVIAEDQEESFVITKDDTKYLDQLEETQVLPEIKYKGIVSKIDTKASSGYLDISSKRLAFTFQNNLPEEQFAILIESLKRKIQIYLVGSVVMDFQNHPSSMEVSRVESDVKLF